MVEGKEIRLSDFQQVTSVEINLVTQDPGASSTAPLQNAWVYLQDGSSITLLRSDENGRVKSLAPGGERTNPRDYTVNYATAVGTTLNLYFSRGVKPIHDTILSSRSAIFSSQTVQGGTGGVSQITLPNILMTITQPEELSIWPLLWELPEDDYLTLGINQGGTLWTSVTGSGNLTVTENGSANDPGPDRPAHGSDQVRPRERGLKVVGTIDARATDVKLQVLDTSGTPIQLKQNSTDTTGITEITVTPGTASGNMKPFEATVYFLNSAAAFGPVQILILSDGMIPQIVGTFACHLTGLQIALVNDYLANPNGQSQGPVHTEADERVVVDFRDSPQSTRADISDQTRARRMVTYQMANRDRVLSATNATTVLKPEMPLWMAEFQIVGMSRTQLEDLLARRKQFLTGNPANLRFGILWKLTLSWDGPDSGTSGAGSQRRYLYSVRPGELGPQDFSGTQTATISLNASNQIDGVNAQGQVANAFSPAPTALTFPVTGRRLSQVVVSGQTRRWGRQSSAPTRDTVLIEWQPCIVNAAGNEIMRGGDGVLKLESVTIGGARIDGGLIPSAGGTASPPADAPDMKLPTFRVRGLNPPSPANDVIDALVEDYFNNNNTVPRITLLTLACWQETVRRILAHEAGHQFEYRGASRRRYKGQYYGHEQDMPIFGPPHGYGYGQHDSPPVTGDGAWSFFENLRESVRRIMEDKARDAYTLISQHMPATPNQRIRAIYQREIVRRYNGGREFQWNGTDWEINPSLNRWAKPSDHSQGANPRLPYPNRVLGTNIVYSSGSGAATTFPWPITYTAANYGPGT